MYGDSVAEHAGFPNNHVPILVVRRNLAKSRSRGCLALSGDRKLTAQSTVGTTVSHPKFQMWEICDTTPKPQVAWDSGWWHCASLKDVMATSAQTAAALISMPSCHRPFACVVLFHA